VTVAGGPSRMALQDYLLRLIILKKSIVVKDLR